jgi:hypothetical protein
MSTSFCAEESLLYQESIIGNALDYRLYFLIEVAPPWEYDEFQSKSIPENLRSLISKMIPEDEDTEVQFLLISNQQFSTEFIKLIIYSKESGLSAGYLKQEIQFNRIEEIAPFIEKYLTDSSFENQLKKSDTRDVLVCTHGSQDICCARYGNPFYREALATVSQLNMPQVRVWQVSHIGGHRFAPTAIDFPDGRYYGRLDGESFASILTRSGDIKCLEKIYRGWAIFPRSVQFVERELIWLHGWDWFNYKVNYQTSDRDLESGSSDVEITCEKPNGDRYKYQARVVADPSKTIYLKGSCNSQELYEFPHYIVQDLQQIDCFLIPTS